MTISIEEFYKKHSVDSSFNEIEYIKENPDTKDFYQPYCKENNFTDKQRLYYHYFFYSPIKNKTVVIKVYGDIPQKIKTINSFLGFAKKIAAKIKVCWGDDNHFEKCHFNDLFQTIPDIDFISYEEYLRYKKSITISLNSLFISSSYLDQKKYIFFAEPYSVLGLLSTNGFSYEGLDCIEDMFDDIIDLDMIYHQLKPRHIVKSYNDIENHIGVYLPKNSNNINLYTKTKLETLRFQNIVRQVESEIKNDPQTNLFLITDCIDTGKLFLEKFPKTTIVHSDLNTTKNNITQIDILFLLSQTKKIIANYGDTFSYVASKIGHKPLSVCGSLLDLDTNLFYKDKYDKLINSVIKNNNSVSQHQENNKIILYTQMFKSSTEVLAYNTYCLYKNLANKHIDQIVLFTDCDSNFKNVFGDKLIVYSINNRLTYKEWLELSYKLHPTSIKVLANSDIYFDETIYKLNNIEKWNSDIFYVSSRKDETKDGRIIPSKLYHTYICPTIDIEKSHDVWIYKNPLKNFNSNYYLGFMGCDSKIIDSLTDEEMQIINLYFYINCIHVDWRQSKTRPSYLLPK